MLWVISQGICTSLVAISLVLILIELRTRFDASQFYVGLTVILLCLFSAIDLWGPHPIASKYWHQIQHLLFVFIPPVIIKYLSILTTKDADKLVRLLFALGIPIGLVFLTGIMFTGDKHKILPTAYYMFIFFPYLVYSIVTVISFIVSSLSVAPKSLKKILQIHLFCFAILAICGSLDLVRLLTIGAFRFSVPSFTLLGTLFVCSTILYLFSERLIRLIRENLVFTTKLQDAYRDLESARNLSEIGRSTAIINHEIKNFTTVILGYGQFLKDKANLAPPFRDMADKIIDTADRLTSFSQEILDFSKSKILSDKKPLAIVSLIHRCIETHFPTKISFFSFVDIDKKVIVYGDWRKLEQVFVNLFKNALEAKAKNIRIKFVQSEFILLISIEDDGVGVDAKYFKHLFEAFHTTKQSGTGLGLPTSRSIIEGHGGHISAVSKNILGKGNHGLRFNIVFPTYTDKPSEDKTNIVFIKDRVDNLAEIIKVFQNVFVTPHVIDSIEEIQDLHLNINEIKVLASPHIVAKAMEKKLPIQCYSLVSGTDAIVRVISSPPENFESVFCEEFVLEKLKQNTASPSFKKNHRIEMSKYALIDS